MQKWLYPPAIDVPAELRAMVSGHPLVARLLAQRGFADPLRAQAFLDPALYTLAPAQDLAGVSEAVGIIRQRVASGKRIRIWGDFDADGQTATALLYEALSAIGARADYQIPTRREGHGLNQRAIQQALADDITLLITCDTGISDAALVSQAMKAGLGVIITDHHDLPDTLPAALCIINPKTLDPHHPSYHLAGVGTAYYLARGLIEDTPNVAALSSLLDLVALGSVADVAYQVDDVRYLIQLGLRALQATARPGLRALYSAAQLDTAHLSEGDIGFQIAPRLNAAGRLGDAGLAIRLLLTHNPDEARELAGQLEALNQDRQARTESTLAAAERRLQENPEWLRQPILVVDGENWEEGVLGLVAATLVRRYQRPAVVIAHRPDTPSVGSARSIEGIDIHLAIASQHALLMSQGGHPMAAGLSLPPENTPAFRRGICEWASQMAVSVPLADTLAVDGRVPWPEITSELAQQIGRLAPFGAGNPRPVLVASGAMLVRIEDVSRRNATPHRRLICTDTSGRQLSFVWFNAASEAMPEPGQPLELAFYIQTNYWQGQERLVLELAAWRPFNPVSAETAESLVAGIEVLDWRRRPELAPLLEHLRADYGEQLAIWCEGTSRSERGFVARHQLYALDPAPLALAILTPPPSPELLMRAVSLVKPQILVLLPPQMPPEFPAQTFITYVLGMVRSSLASPALSGALDIDRMAARLAARPEAVVAALRGLEASQVFSLKSEHGGLYAETVAQGSDGDSASGGGQAEPIDGNPQAAVEQARQALRYQLRETHAYRQAYCEVEPRTLLVSQLVPTARNGQV